MKLLLRLPILLLASNLLSGCGTMADPREWFSSDDPALEPAELVDFTPTVQPQQVWSMAIGDASSDLQRLKPAVDNGVLYVANTEGDLFAVDADAGKPVWKVETGLPVSAGPGVADGLLALGTAEGQLVLFDAGNGEELWRKALSSEILAVPAIGGGVVVVHTGDGKLFGLDATSGEQLWLYDHKVPVLTLRGSSSPVISGGSVYCGLAGGKMIALSLDSGLVEWESRITVPAGRSDLERMVDVDTDPLLYSGSVYGGAYQGDVAALGEGSGKEFWKRKISVYNNLAVNWQQLAVSDAQGFVWSLDPDTGSARWRQKALMNRQLSAPALQGDFTVVGDFEGYLHWLSSEDGAMAARMDVGDAIVAAPLVVDDSLYVLSSDGKLTALRLPE
ncbi:MAG TPA: outer membrane protein assembly factor BamB [Chromatiaceae bacterium]|nr:outer membrane protein assembly factor BamB [Chromatiaceae bacterium]